MQGNTGMACVHKLTLHGCKHAEHQLAGVYPLRLVH